MARFCWRERSERVNWRLLRGLQLAEVVRRGDATLLEPYALHLTFARLPVVVASLGAASRHDADAVADSDDAWPSGDPQGPARNAWFVARVLQLSMEYLLFLRARDGTVVDSLREELLVCERECELLVERARKWKDRSRSGERQVEKLHQVLQNIAKLLQIEGATPNAVTTIESLLRDLVPRTARRDGQKLQEEPSVSHVEEARVCALCGKMFSSQEFLDKHAIRRHPGVDVKTVRDAGKRTSSRSARTATEDAPNNQGEAQTDHANDMKAMLRTVEQTLQAHQSALRTVAQEEADKLHSLYEQLHVETQLAEEMRTKRAAVEKEVEKRQRELDAIEQEKEDVAEELRVMKEQLEFLAMKKKIEAQNGVSQPASQHDPTLQLEIKRLEETVGMLKDALSTSREELQRTHETHGVLLKEKVVLETQLHEAQSHAARLELSLRGTHDYVPPVRVDMGVQAVATTSSLMTQTDEIEQEPTAAVVLVPPARVAAGEAAVQTEELDRAERTDTMVQTDPELIPPPADLVRTRSPTTSIGVGVGADLVGEEDLDSVFKLKCASILDLVQRRADRLAHTKSAAAADPHNDEKIFSSLSRRRYLRSRFLHEERAVGERIAAHIGKLEQTSLRYGVSPKSSVLANEHIEVVQRALHAHLEVLPSEVLQRMIDIENSVNTLIQKHWMPQEKSRQDALNRLTAGLEAKSQVNQGLVRQAMVAFNSNATVDTTQENIPSTTNSDEVRSGSVGAQAALEVMSVPASNDSQNPTQVNDAAASQLTEMQHKEVEEFIEKEEEKRPQLSRPESIQTCVPSTTAGRASDEPSETEAGLPTLATSEASANQQQGEPSPVSVQEVRRQSIAVRSVKVVSVSPKSSPPKSPPRAPTLANEMRGRESEKAAAPEVVHIPIKREGPLAESTNRKVEVTVLAGASDVASSTDTAAPPVQAVQPSGTSVMHSGAPSSFSAKHPESQLGIVIPSRYDPNTISVHGLQNDPDEMSAGDFLRREPIQELRWSSSAGRSGGASERSLSAVESSEMSFDASIPSLGSEGVGVSRSFPRSSTEQLPTVPSSDELHQIPDDADIGVASDVRGIDAIKEELSDAEENAVQTLAPEEREPQLLEPQRSPRLSPRPNEIMAFSDDDSDIEEVVLA